MSNPYEGFDAIDPWDETDELEDDLDSSGNFEYVEDAYAPLVEDGTDGLGSLDAQPLPTPAPLPTPTNNPVDLGDTQPGMFATEVDQFPKTMVRPYYGVVQDAPDPQTMRRDEPGNTLVRHRRQRMANQGAGATPRAVPSPPMVDDQMPTPRQSRRERARARKAEQRAMRAQRRQRRPRRRHGFLKFLAILTAITVGVYLVVCGPIDHELAFSQQEAQTVRGKTAWGIPGMPYYVLALGSDAREGDTYSRTDTMMLIRVDLLAGKLTLVSIPRDTKVELPGQGTQKINAAYAFGGAGEAVQAVADLTGVPVNHVAVIHFGELADLIDYLGGVTVNVPVSVYDPEHTGLVLDAGTQTLNGTEAVLWARTRYGFEDGDFQRQADQRILVTAIMEKLLTLSPKKWPDAIQKIGDLIGTDLRCYDLIPLFLRLQLGKPVVYSCSIPSTTAMIDGQSFVIADEEGLSNVMHIVNSGGDPAALGY